MIQSLRTSIPGVKQVWLADDSEGGGQIVPLYNWCNHLRQEGKITWLSSEWIKELTVQEKWERELGVKVGAKKKNDDLQASTFQLLNGTEMGSF